MFSDCLFILYVRSSTVVTQFCKLLLKDGFVIEAYVYFRDLWVVA